MNGFTITVLLFFIWCCWLDYIYPDDLDPQPDPTCDDSTQVQTDGMPHPTSTDLWSNGVMAASGLQKPRFKTESLTKDIEHIDLTPQLDRPLDWSVKYLDDADTNP